MFFSYIIYVSNIKDWIRIRQNESFYKKKLPKILDAKLSEGKKRKKIK